MILLFSIVGHAEKVTPVDSTLTAKINPTVMYFTEKLEKLAESLKVPAEHVYGVLVKQQVVIGYTYLIGVVVSILIMIISLYIFTKVEGFDEDNFINIFSFILIILFGLLFVTMSILFMSDGIGGILNPEYGALKEIMSIF